MTSTPRTASPSPRSASGTARLFQLLEAALKPLQRFTLPLMRVCLGVVYVWFGALKLTDSTPVGQLVAKTVPFLPEHVFVPILGAIEVIIGFALISGRFLDIVSLIMVGHLAGTFLVLVTQPGVSFQNGNPLLLTMTGEFVVKNIVLMSAGLVLATRARERAPRAALAVETPLVAEPAAAAAVDKA